MYQPRLNQNTISTLYRMKRSYKKPMTRILEAIITVSVKLIDKDEICNQCKKDGNNNCLSCLFTKGEKQ